jgi:hypothetical protein
MISCISELKKKPLIQIAELYLLLVAETCSTKRRILKQYYACLCGRTEAMPFRSKWLFGYLTTVKIFLITESQSYFHQYTAQSERYRSRFAENWRVKQLEPLQAKQSQALLMMFQQKKVDTIHRFVTMVCHCICHNAGHSRFKIVTTS